MNNISCTGRSTFELTHNCSVNRCSAMYQNHYHQVVCFHFLIQLKLAFLASIKYNIHVSFSSNLELNKKPAKVNFFSCK